MDWNRRAAVFLAFAGSAVAQAEGKLDLSQLVREALERNPEILAAQKKYEAARQRPAQEGALPDPMFSAGWNSSGNPLPGAGLGTEPVANIGAMLSQPLPAPANDASRARSPARKRRRSSRTMSPFNSPSCPASNRPTTVFSTPGPWDRCSRKTAMC